MDHSEYREEIVLDEHPRNYDHSEPRSRMIAIYMAATVVFLVFIGIAIQAYYELTYNNEEYQRVLSQDNWTLRDLRNKEQWELTHYGYVEKEKGTVRIPIDQAMQLILQDNAENKLKYPTNPYPVKTPEQLAAAGTPAVSAPGATAATAGQNQGSSSPNVQPPAPVHK
jgi:hypothetical protein